MSFNVDRLNLVRSNSVRFVSPNESALRQVVVIEIMAVNPIIVIADQANLAENLDFGSKLLPNFAHHRLRGVSPYFDAASGGFDRHRIAEDVGTLHPQKIEVRVSIDDDGPRDWSIMINIFERPFGIFELKTQWFLSHTTSMIVRASPIDWHALSKTQEETPPASECPFYVDEMQ